MVKFADSTKVQQCKDRGYEVVTTEMGEVLVDLGTVVADDTVELDLGGFWGIKEPRARGVDIRW